MIARRSLLAGVSMLFAAHAFPAHGSPSISAPPTTLPRINLGTGFGILGDGVTDDTAALNTALAFCRDRGLEWDLPSTLNCLVTGPVTAYTAGRMAGSIICATNGQAWFPFNVAPLPADVTTIPLATLNNWSCIVKDNAAGGTDLAPYYGCTVWWYTSDEQIIARNGSPGQLNYADAVVVEDPSGNFYPPVLKTKSVATWVNAQAQAVRNRAAIVVEGVNVRFLSGSTESAGGIMVTRPNTLMLRPSVINTSAGLLQQAMGDNHASGVVWDGGYAEGSGRNSTNYGFTTGIGVGSQFIGCKEIYCRRGFDTTFGKNVGIVGGQYPDGVGGHWCAGLDVGGGATISASTANEASGGSPNTAPIWVAGKDVSVHDCKIIVRPDIFMAFGVRSDLFELAGAARLTNNDIIFDCTGNTGTRRYLFSAATTSGTFDYGRQVSMPAMIEVSGNRVRQIGTGFTENLSLVSMFATGSFASPSGLSWGGQITVKGNSWNLDADALNGTAPRLRVDLLKLDAVTAGLGVDNVGYTINLDDLPHVNIYLYCSPNNPNPSLYRHRVTARCSGTFGWGANYGAFQSLRASFGTRTSAWSSSRPSTGYQTAIGDEIELRDDDLFAQTTWRPGSLTAVNTAGSTGAIAVSVPGAAIGDTVLVDLSSVSTSGSSTIAWSLRGEVSATGSVYVTLVNLNAGAQTVASGTLTVRVRRS